MNPFGQFLAGVVRQGARRPEHAQSREVSASAAAFAIQPGGGVDIRLSDSVAVRVQVDFPTTFVDGSHGTAFRFAPGIVIRTGGKAYQEGRTGRTKEGVN